MLEIRENFSAEGYEEIIRTAGQRSVHITEAFEKNEKTGFIAYCYDTDKTSVLAIDDGGDLMLCDGLVRSVMFKSTLKGINCLVFELVGEDGYKNLERLKFLTDNSRICGDIDRFMNGCANCKNK